MLDEDRTAGLYSFNNNNNVNFPLYILIIHFKLQFRSNNNHSSHAWKRWKWTTSLPCFTYLSHARSLCEHPKFWRVRALSHARVVAPCARTPLDSVIRLSMELLSYYS